MNDELTQRVLAVQAGLQPRKDVEDSILLMVFQHLRNYHRNDEDDVSGFLLEFAGRIGGLVDRFEDRGIPFQHYLMRSMRWQWTSYKARRDHETAQGMLLAEPDNLDYGTPEQGLNPDNAAQAVGAAMAPLEDPTLQSRLLMLALKQATLLEESQIEEICRLASVDLSWLQALVQEVRQLVEPQQERKQHLTERQSEVYWQRLVAEARARREPDPDRRALWEKRAAMYRERLANLQTRRTAMTVVPTHLDLSRLLGIPKGTVDSGIYHLKKELACLYTDGHDPAGDQQWPQKRRARAPVSRRRARSSF
ncbi:MAG: hypothetical protein WCG80_19735 [Spirochaetales bacterium]